MKRTLPVLLAIVLLAGGLFISNAPSADAQQEIQAIKTISRFLGDNYEHVKVMLRLSHNMQREAQPFTKPRHRERFRFEPNDKNPREVMMAARKCAGSFKIVNGMLSRSGIENRKMIFEDIALNLESIDTFSKRAIRAIKDNNYALYLASAKGIEGDVYELNEILHNLELEINNNIYEYDSMKESL